MAASGPSLPKNVRKAVSSVAEKLFVDQQSYARYQKASDIRKGNEYTTSLPLQMALYFNSFYFPLWLISSCIIYQSKYNCLDGLYRIILISLIIVMSIVEIIRLYLGYLGNLTEKVPELAGSWLLTILLQLPSIFFLLFNYQAIKSLPMEIAMNIILAIFVACEIVIGAVALRTMVNHQVSLFHLQQFVKAEDVTGDAYGDANPTFSSSTYRKYK